MNTQRLMEIALDMAGLSEIPGDSAVHHAGQAIRRLLVGIAPCVDRLSPRRTQRRTIPVLEASQIHSASIVARISTTPARRPLRRLRTLRLPADFAAKDWT